MGDLFVDFVAEHHAERSRLIDRSEAIDILIAEAERGHVHHAFFKEAAFGRFFAICNCCYCCCGAMQAYRNGIPMLASSGYVCVVDKNKCETCGICVDKCPFGAIQLDGVHLRIDPHACMGCGVCQHFCSQHALSLKRNYLRSDPLELDELLSAVGEH
jgi:dissimilatory sulfite reductase (desulfoviridin) alpha/beta subunit